MQHFTQLEVWKNGLLLVEEIHRLSKKFPKDELFALTSQVRKSSTSVLANIAEGFGRYTYPDKAARYIIARGECYETEAHMLIAVALKYVSNDETSHALELIQKERMLLSGLIRSCKKH